MINKFFHYRPGKIYVILTDKGENQDRQKYEPSSTHIAYNKINLLKDNQNLLCLCFIKYLLIIIITWQIIKV